MILKKTDKKIVCDLMGCKNKASYVLKKEDALFNNSLFICEHCLKKMNELFSKELTPKSIKNIYRRKENNETE